MRFVGFTLIEVTLSIALLAGIAMGAGALVTTVSRNEQAVREATQWRRAAGEVISRIRDDLRSGDFDIAIGDQKTKSRVRVNGGFIEIDTRSRSPIHGSVVARYSVTSGELMRTESTDTQTESRTLMLATTMAPVLDVDRGVLTVTLLGPGSLQAEHEERIP